MLMLESVQRKEMMCTIDVGVKHSIEKHENATMFFLKNLLKSVDSYTIMGYCLPRHIALGSHKGR